MDTREFITLVFPLSQSEQNERKVEVGHILEHAPKSSVGLYLRERKDGNLSLSDDPFIITQYSAEQWDICLGIAEGLLDLYEQHTEIKDVYRRHFDKGMLDGEEAKMIRDISKSLSEINRLISRKSPGLVCVSEYVYKTARETAVISGLIPFQVITVNDHPRVICFDHGIPVPEDDGIFDTPLTDNEWKVQLMKDRVALIGRLGSSSFWRQSAVQPLYGDKYNQLTAEYTQGRGLLDRITLEAIWIAGRSMPYKSCGDDKCTYSRIWNAINLETVDLKQRCKCMIYQEGQKYLKGSRDYSLENTIDLSSLDEVKFIKAVANILVAKRSVDILDPIISTKYPHTWKEYLEARIVVHEVGLWPQERAISSMRNDNRACIQLYLGFVKV